MSESRNVTIPAYLPEPGQDQLEGIERLLRKFGNARRRSYNMQSKGIARSAGLKRLQKETGLNRRYVQDAWDEVKSLPEMVTFGGLRNQRLMEKGKISVEEWHKRRNSILISRGDGNNDGNANLRVVEDGGGLKLRINVGSREWIFPDLYVPDKYLERYGHLLDGSKPYKVLIKRRGEKRYEVKITVHPDVGIEEKKRTMAIDLNSGFLDYSVVEKGTKRLIESDRISFHDILDSSTGKTENILHEVVSKVGNIAGHYGAEVVCGRFETGSSFFSPSQANRRIKGMSQYKFREILKYKLTLEGIPVKFRSEPPSAVGRELGKMLGLDAHKGSSYLFALKTINYHFFTFLRSVLADDGGGSLGGKLSEGSGLTALVKAYASGNGNLVGLATLSLDSLFPKPPDDGATPRDLVGAAPEREFQTASY